VSGKRARGNDTAAEREAGLRQRAERIARERKDRGMEDPAALSPADARRLLHDLQVHQIELELQNEELRRSQIALEDSRTRYFDLYNLAPVGYFTLDGNGVILEANLTGATLLGVTRDALVGQPLGRFVAAADADMFHIHLRQLVRTGAPQACELRLSRKGAAPFTAWLEASAVASAGGAPACRVVISDISERKDATERLRQKKNLLHVAGTMAQLGGWAIKLPQNELTWTDETCALLDFPIGAAPPFAEALSLYPPASRRIFSGALDSCARDGTPFDCELQMSTAKHRRIDVRAIGQAVRDAHGKITGIEGAFQDISERKTAEQARASLEAQLRESQKMEAIGTLASGIAHDFNNIIATILGNIDLARQDAGANWQALVSLDEIQKAGYRARDLVQQILTFSRRQPTSHRVISLAPVVEEAVQLLRALPGGVRIESRCAADTPSVLADPTQVQQVILNLGTNAAQAMEGRPGRIDILVEGVTQDEASARSNPDLRPGRYARVVVSDTGHGMDGATLRRIFEPFFTTKPPGKGTGLGLSVAHGIMQAHEGAIVAHSEPGRGSSFELYFPRAQSVAHALAAPEAATPASEGRGQHVLYIDDDEAHLFLIKRTMERWGYRVSAYLEQREALDALLAGAVHFDLVMTDFKMPGMSGLEVAQAIHRARPDLPVIVISGYINEELRAQAAAAGVSELVFKAQELEELRDVVQRLVPPPKTADRGPA
jgi:two-component system, cell cycle sensor histidine kinase and response regulator CckA